MSNNTTIPTKETFKEEAKKLLQSTPIIKNISSAQDILARDKYKKKDYATIKPLFKKSIYPLNQDILEEYLKKEISILEKMTEDIYAQYKRRSLELYLLISQVYFNHKKYHPSIKNKRELDEFQKLMGFDNLFILLKKEIIFNKIDNASLIKHPLYKYIKKHLSDHTIDILDSLNSDLTWKEGSFYNIETVEAVKQISGYYFQSTYIFFKDLDAGFHGDNHQSIAKELLKNTTNIFLQKFINEYIRYANNRNDFEYGINIYKFDRCIQYILLEKFNIEGWAFYEQPVDYCFCFRKESTGQMFDLQVHDGHEVLPSFVNGSCCEETVTSINKAIEKYSLN